MKLVRTGLYALVLLLFLASLTYKIYFSPGQMENRIAAGLKPYLTRTPLVSGATQGWLSPLMIREIRFPASPVIEEESLLVLRDLQVRDLDQGWGDSRRNARGLSIRIREAELFLDREVKFQPGRALTPTTTWS